MVHRSRIKCVLILASNVLAMACVFAQNVSLELNNGDRLSGTIVSENAERLVLSNVWTRELAVPMAEIFRRTMVLPPTNAVAVVTGTNAPGTNAVAATNAIAVAKAVAATNALFTAPWMANWHGDIQVGTDLTFSERNRQVFNARSKLTYTKDRFKTILDYDMTYGRSRMEGADEWNVDANRMNGAIKTDFDLAKKWYVYNLAGAGYDEIRRIDLRYEVGPGVGYHLIQRPTFLMNVEAGATYQDEERADGSELSTFYLRFGQNSVWKITPRLTLDEKFEYFPRVSDFEMYRLRFEANLRYALLQNVFVSLSVIDTYDTQTATGVPNNDLQIRSSVGVKF